MDALLGLTGVLGIIIGLIWIVVGLVRKGPLKIPSIVLVFAILLFSAGLAMPPAADQQDEGSGPAGDSGPAVENGVAEEPEVGETGEVAGEKEPADSGQEGSAADSRAPPSGRLEVHFIDVGQGDAILVKTPGKNILIDAGWRGDTVVNYLRSEGVESLDLVIGTHPHADHIGGLINVMEQISVREVFDPGVVHTTKTFEDYLTVIDQKNIIFTEGRTGLERDIGGGAVLEIIHPSSPSEDHLNNASIVARVAFGQISFLFTGDAEKEAEGEILNRGYNPESTILKVGHHGSSTSTTQAFLRAVNPEAAVIMCGEDNQYGHPHEETVDRLTAAGVDIYRTDLHGTIVISTDGQSYSVERAGR